VPELSLESYYDESFFLSEEIDLMDESNLELFLNKLAVFLF